MLMKPIAKLIAHRIVEEYQEENKRIKALKDSMNPRQLWEYEECYAVVKKNLLLGYCCWSLFGAHYLYVRKPVKQLIFWGTLGGLMVWYLLDLLLMCFIIDSYNRKRQIEILEDIRATENDTRVSPQETEVIELQGELLEDEVLKDVPIVSNVDAVIDSTPSKDKERHGQN